MFLFIANVLREKTLLQINKNQDSAYDTEVEINGTEEQKAKAKQIVEDLTIPAGDYQKWGEREARRNGSGKNETVNNDPPPPIDWGQLKARNEAFQAAKFADLPVIKKNFYRENKKIATLDPSDVAEIR